MKFSEMQNEIYRSVVTIQYNTKCTNPLYPKFTSNNFSAYNCCCNLYLVIAYVLIPTSDKYLHPFICHCPQITGQLLQQKCIDMAFPSKYDNRFAEKNTDNNCKTRCHTFEGEPAMILEPVIMEYKRYKFVQPILNICDFSV